MSDVPERTQQDFFPQSALKSSSVPPEYRPIKISCTNGALSAPPVLHFRNYSMEECIQLSETAGGEEEETLVLCSVLTKMNYENFDCTLLHPEELLEILFRIYAIWWGKTLDSYRYYVDISLQGEALDTKENISTADIPVSAIYFHELENGVQDPISITIDEVTHKFILPRVSEDILVHQKLKEKFAEKDQQATQIAYQMKRGEFVSMETMSWYQKFAIERNKEMNRYRQAFRVVTNPEATLEERCEMLKTIDLRFFKKYNNLLETKFRFGIEPEVKFQCSVKNVPIARRFRFRYEDFIPSVESGGDLECDVSFG